MKSAFKFPGVVTAAARSIQSAGRATLQEWIMRNRDLLADAIQNDTENARLMLVALCRQAPAVAGGITLIMNGTPDQAVNAIAMFDVELADRLRPILPDVARLQKAWRME